MAKVIGGIMYGTDGDSAKVEYQAASTATTVAATVADLNALIAKLKAAGIMSAEAPASNG